jgi:hypothetical protein
MKASPRTIRSELRNRSLFTTRDRFESLHIGDPLCLTQKAANRTERRKGTARSHMPALVTEPQGTQACVREPSPSPTLHGHLSVPCPLASSGGPPMPMR